MSSLEKTFPLQNVNSCDKNLECCEIIFIVHKTFDQNKTLFTSIMIGIKRLAGALSSENKNCILSLSIKCQH